MLRQLYDRAELDRQYSPSGLVASLDRYLEEYAERSARARRSGGVRAGVRYGPAAVERFDFWRTERPAAPTQVFVHGGNWQQLTERSSGFAALQFRRRGAAFAAIGYGLAPDYSLDEIVAQVRRCVWWIHRNATSLGVDPDQIHLSGTSAGAHLAAMTLVAGGRNDSGTGGFLASATLLSGIYDLGPIRQCYVNDALGLDADAVRRNSPPDLLPPVMPPTILARGGRETDEYVRQHDLMAKRLRSRCALREEIVDNDRNHFDLPFDLGDPSTRLGRAVLTQMRLLR